MYELTVQTVFSAAHSLRIAGVSEPVHGHDWHVTACIAGRALDADGLLVDFHAVEECLAGIVRPFRNADLNATPPFDRVNPSAEHVARHIAQSLSERLRTLHGVAAGPADTAPRVDWVRVTEAPGCAVTYRSP